MPAISQRLWIMFIAALALLIAELSLRTQQLATLNHIYSDSWHQWAGQRYTPQHVVLITVDDASLAAQADTPLVFWSPYFARAAAVLTQVGVRRIGLDFLPAITPETWLNRTGLSREALPQPLQNYDLAFRQTLNQGQLILVASFQVDAQGGQDQLLLPHPDYLLSLPNLDIPRYVGFANLHPDADGGVRRFISKPALNLAPELRSGAPQYALAALMAGAPDKARSGLIHFAGPPGSFPSLPISRLLAPNAAQDPAVRALAGKIILIGAHFQGMGDTHSTPYSRAMLSLAGQNMSGVEIHANIIETLLARNPTQNLATLPRLILLTVLFISATLLFQRLALSWGVLLAVAFLIGLLLIGQGLFYFGFLLPAADAQLGLLICWGLSYGRRFTRETRERRKIQQLFSRYVSSAVLNKIMAQDKLPDLGGESYQLTVLFADIRDFTAISEQLSAHEVVEFLNVYFEQICAPVFLYGGSIDKFIGDAIMVQFGAPLATPDHARRAVQTALAIQAAAQQFATWMETRFAGRNLPPFRIGIGLHTGVAVVGHIGSQRRMEYTAIGDTINLAARIESATKELGCTLLASSETLAAAGGGIVTGRQSRINVKGRQQSVDVIEILDSRVEQDVRPTVA
ncbi:adenylate/guanylate cyclase domain-containing protein [Deefgea rivuli]|uniref:adenylate/guanylate cyclase domain-containing protein n=1 Tax=Deefgea rivuli TaxID=400948 RepID=UPI00068885A0|nr:adenylate/guanylate cyclase domain-containing protein [Deefgea rivuli]